MEDDTNIIDLALHRRKTEIIGPSVELDPHQVAQRIAACCVHTDEHTEAVLVAWLKAIPLHAGDAHDIWSLINAQMKTFAARLQAIGREE